MTVDVNQLEVAIPFPFTSACSRVPAAVHAVGMHAHMSAFPCLVLDTYIVALTFAKVLACHNILKTEVIGYTPACVCLTASEYVSPSTLSKWSSADGDHLGCE